MLNAESCTAATAASRASHAVSQIQVERGIPRSQAKTAAAGRKARALNFVSRARPKSAGDALERRDPGHGLDLGRVQQEDGASQDGRSAGDMRRDQQHHEEDGVEGVQQQIDGVVAGHRLADDPPLRPYQQQVQGRIVG